MTRFSRRVVVPPKSEIGFALRIGPTAWEGFTEQQLALAWQAYGEEILSDCAGIPGVRPWAFWKYELNERRPEGSGAEAVRIAELGLLRDDEIAAIAGRANEAKARIGTDAEYRGPSYWPDRDAVELHEAVQAGANQPSSNREAS